MASKLTILFVDDQPNILEGLRRSMRKMRNEWDMTFVTSGREALAEMDERPFDVIVTDMMMPEMTGVEVLKTVAARYPETVRYVLSGHSDREMILQSTGFAHRYLAKPCDPDELKQLLNNSLGLRETLARSDLHRRISSIGSLPSRPEIYTALMSELQSDTASVEKIAQLVSKDVGITAKLLQMVNSAFFGLPTQVESPLQAVNLLGFDTVQGLVLAAGTFSRLEADGLPGLSIDGIYPHSMAVGTGAQKIAKALDLDKRKAQDALMAGLLHDIGHLVMLRYFRPELQEALKLSGGVWSELIGAEQQVLGATHAEIGAHLLSLWGLPDSIVEAVAYHHVPSQTPHPMIDVLTAVHLANAFERDHDGVEETHLDLIDNTYITNLGLSERLASLREASPAPVAE